MTPRIFLPLLLLTLAACDGGAEAQRTESQSGSAMSGMSSMRETPGGRARRWIEEGATLVDVRTPGEFGGGHIEGAVNIPVQVLADRMSEIPTDHKVVVYCRSGARSSHAARMLDQAGYEVFDLGSIQNW